MDSDDTPIPEHDPIALAARAALGDIAELAPTGSLSWDAIRHGARRAQRRRVAALSAVCVAIVLAVSTAVALGQNGSDRSVHVVGPGSTTSAPSTATAPAPTTTGSTTNDSTPTSVRCCGPVTVETNPTTTTDTSPPRVLQPQEGSWSATTSVDKSVVTVGSDFVVTVKLTNTGTQPQTTIGYSSYGIGCIAFPYADVRDGLPTGQFFAENPVLQPGETHSFSITFRAEPGWVGSLRCGAGYASHGDAYATFGEPAVAVEVVTGPDPTTTSSTTTSA